MTRTPTLTLMLMDPPIPVPEERASRPLLLQVSMPLSSIISPRWIIGMREVVWAERLGRARVVGVEMVRLPLRASTFWGFAPSLLLTC